MVRGAVEARSGHHGVSTPAAAVRPDRVRGQGSERLRAGVRRTDESRHPMNAPATPARPHIDCEQQHPSLAVGDVLAAADFYSNKLGFSISFTWGEPPSMAGVNLGHVQVFLEQGTPSPNGISVYFVVGDADELYDFHRANGVEILVEPGDRRYGL